jgi:hypothetical protein
MFYMLKKMFLSKTETNRPGGPTHLLKSNNFYTDLVFTTRKLSFWSKLYYEKKYNIHKNIYSMFGLIELFTVSKYMSNLCDKVGGCSSMLAF